MSLGSTILASLGLNIGKFRAGLNDAVTKAGDARKKIAKQLEPIGGGALIGRLGVVGAIAGFMGVVKAAQRARDEAAAMGKEIDASTAAAARLADTFGTVGEKVQNIAIGGIGILQRGIDELALRTVALFTGDNVEELRAYMAENEKRAAKAAEQAAAQKKAQDEAAKAQEDADKREQRDIGEIAKMQEKIGEEQRKRIEMTETTEQKIKRLRESGLSALNRANDVMLSIKDRVEARLRAEQIGSELLAEQLKIQEQQKTAAEEEAKAQADKAKSLREQLQTLREQASAIVAAMKQMERARNLPSLAEVASGQRNIGSGARRSANELDRVRQQEQRAADRAQRAFERRNEATTDSARDAAEKERQRAVADMEKAAGRRKGLERSLTGRVGGIGNEAEQAQLDELKEIRTAVEATANALAITEGGGDAS
jgi:hypothetical protein